MNTVFSLPEPESSLGPFMPVLDDAINRLSAPDRAAIVLRFFEQRDFRSVAQAIGSTEDAARKRVDRALDKLHLLLKKRGVVFPSTALAAGLATEAVVAAPAGMASGIAGAALATAAAGSGSVVATLVNLIAGANLKAAATGAVVLVTAVVAPLVIHHNVRMADKDQALRLQTEQLAQLQSDNEQLAEWLAIMDAGEPPTSEVLRLRNEVGLLRREVSEMQTFGNLQTQYQAARSGVLEQVVAEGILLSNEERTIGFPRELWRFSGYGTPKAAVQSMLWAASQGDGTAYLNGYTAKARQVNLRNRWQGLTEAEVGAERRAVMEKVTHFSVFSNRYSPLDSSEISEITQVSIGLRPHGEHATGQALSINYSMIRDGDEWKCCNETRTVRVRSAPTQP